MFAGILRQLFSKRGRQLINPLLHFQKHKLAPKTFGFRQQVDLSGSLRTPQRNWITNSLGGSGGPPRGPPDAENRRFSELTCISENEVKG